MSTRRRLSNNSLRRSGNSVNTSPCNRSTSLNRSLSRPISIHDEKKIYRFREVSGGWRSAKDFFQKNEEVTLKGENYKPHPNSEVKQVKETNRDNPDKTVHSSNKRAAGKIGRLN